MFLLGCSIAACSVDSITAAEHAKRAKQYLADGKPAEAFIEFRRAASKESDDSEVYFYIGKEHLRKQEGKLAERAFRRFLHYGGARQSVLPELCQAYLLLGEPNKLLQETANPGALPKEIQVRVLALRARAHLDLKDLQSATRDAQAAVLLDADSPYAIETLAEVLFASRDYDKARELIDKLLAGGTPDARQWMLKGNIEYGVGDLDGALAAFGRAVEQRPDVLNYRLGLARAQSVAGQNQDAIDNINIILKSAPNSRTVRYLLAIVAFRMNDFTTASTNAETVLQSMPSSPQLLLVAGSSFYFQGKMEQALGPMEQFVSLAPNHLPGRKLLAAIKLKLALPKESAKLLEGVENFTEADGELLAALGTALVAQDEPTLADNVLAKATRVTPDDAKALAQIGTARINQGDTQEGEKKLQQSLDLDPSQKGVRIALILAELKSGDADAAMAHAIEYQKRFPGEATGYSVAGLIHAAAGDRAKAVQAFERALNIDPGDANANGNLATYAILDEEPEKARGYYETALRHSPGNLDMIVKLAELYRMQGKVEQESRLLSDALAENPNDLRLTILVARARLRSGQLEDALRIIASGQQTHPKSPDLWDLKGRAQYRNGDIASAALSFERLTELAPNYAEGHFWLAKVYSVQQNETGLRQALSKTLELNPDHILGRIARARLLIGDKQYDKAREILDQLNIDAPNNPEVVSADARLLLLENKADEALARLGEVRKTLPENRFLMAELVQAQLLARRRGDAIRSMEGWLKDHPGDTDFLLALGNEYLTAGVNENAKFVFNRLLALTPRNQVVLNNLAWLIRDDDLTRAIELANAAIEVAPNWFAAQDTLGVLLTKKGDFKRALRHLERANQARPGDPSISYHLAEVLARDGKPARAREVLNDILTSTVDFPERSEARALQDHLK